MNASWLDSSWLARRPDWVRTPPGSDTHIVDLKRVAVRCRVLGEGPPVVMVPDPPNTIEHHAGVQSALARDHRVLCYDPPGFGFSYPRSDFGFSLTEMADVLIALLEKERMQGCTLSVSCLGAFVGLTVAARRPDLVARLLLMQVASHEQMRLWSLEKDVCQIIQTPLLGQLAMKVGKGLVARQWYSSALPEGADRRPFLDITLASFRRGACFGLVSAFQSFQQDRFALEQPVRQPTVVLWGGADRSHAGTHKETILELVPHARLLHFPGCGHFPDLENAPAYLDVLRGLAGDQERGAA